MAPKLNPGILALTLVLAVAAAPPAEASDLVTVAGAIKLPFDFNVDKVNLYQLRSEHGAKTIQNFELTATSGSFNGTKFSAYAGYNAPQGVSAKEMAKMIREASANVAKEPGARPAQPVSLGGVDFYLLDELVGNAADTGSVRRSVHLSGAMDGAQVDVGIAFPTAIDSKFAIDAFNAFAFDRAGVLAYSAGFAEEQKARVVGTSMKTPVGDFAVPPGATATLQSSKIMRDGAGRVLARSMEFDIPKHVLFFVGCSRAGAYGPEDRARTEAWPEGSIKDAPSVEEKQPLQLGGIDGTSRKALRIGTRMDVTHWYGDDADTRYELSLATISGTGSEADLLKQLAESRFRCEEDSSFGPLAGTPAPAAAQ